MKNPLPKKWEEISREERFFTSMLFHDMRADSSPILGFLTGKLNLASATKIRDLGFEVCFFRDAGFAGLIERDLQSEKQTFDLLLTLSDQRMVIIEAKAQQAFDTQQLENLARAKSLIQASKLWPLKLISLVALHSSRYSPGPRTITWFDAALTWEEVADLYPANRAIYRHANSIYADRASGESRSGSTPDT
jgi:hypothetical protein